jgi:hypothetical protein
MREAGVDVVCSGANDVLGMVYPSRPEIVREVLEYCHSIGMKVVYYIDTQVWGYESFIKDGLAGVDEPNESALVIGSGEFPMKSYPGQSCRGSEEYRLMLLSQIRRFVEDFDIDGIYLDNINLNACQNMAHGCSAEGSISTIGTNEFIKGVRLLVGEERIIMGNSLTACAATMGVVDFLYGGEHLVDQEVEEMDSGPLNTYYNSWLYGYQALPCNVRSFDISSDIDIDGEYPRIYEQFLKGSTFLPCNYFPEPVSDNYKHFSYNEIEKKIYDRYTMPFVKFQDKGEMAISPYAVGYSDYIQTDSNDAWVNVYYKQGGEVLLSVINEPHKVKQADIKVNLCKLGIAGKKIMMFDAISDPEYKSGEKLKISKGWIELKSIDVSKGPKIIYLKEIK